MTSEDQATSIWTTRECSVDETIRLAIGTLALSLSRSEYEWMVEYQYSEDRFVRSSEDAVVRKRTAFGQTGSEFLVRPAGANRNVVARPAHELAIPPAESATLYVSSPVWLQFATVEGTVKMIDVPTEILSDTWLGPNTRTGHLAYANETQARMFLDRLPSRPHRMISTVRIVNEGTDMLDIARLSIPVPQLAVYAAGDNLWSSPVEIVREEDLATARLTIGSEPPKHLEAPVRLAEPRTTEEESSVTRAIGFLFG